MLLMLTLDVWLLDGFPPWITEPLRTSRSATWVAAVRFLTRSGYLPTQHPSASICTASKALEWFTIFFPTLGDAPLQASAHSNWKQDSCSRRPPSTHDHSGYSAVARKGSDKARWSVSSPAAISGSAVNLTGGTILRLFWVWERCESQWLMGQEAALRLVQV